MRLLVSGRENNFNALRIAMALLVVWTHSFALYFGTEENEPVSILTSGALDSGKIAVDIFFMISGFLILGSFEKSTSHWSYLRKRVSRIFPAYLVAITVCGFVMLPLVGELRYSTDTVLETLWRNLLLQGWFVPSRAFEHNPMAGIVNGSLWSIPFEFWCYLGVMVFGLIAATRARRALLLAAFAMIMALDMWTLYTDKSWGGGLLATVLGWPNIWFRMAPCFIGGMLVYLYRNELPRSPWLACIAVILLIAGSRMSPVAVGFLVPVCLTYLVFFVAFSHFTFDAARHGDFSYGTYLYAWPIQQLLVAYAGLSFPVFVMTAAALSLLAGVASWFAVEHWFVHTRNKPRPGPAVAAPAFPADRL